MLLDGGDNRKNKQSVLTTNAHVADINTYRQLVQNAGNVARRDILCQCAGQNISTKSKQFFNVHETCLLSTTSYGLYSVKTLRVSFEGDTSAN